MELSPNIGRGSANAELCKNAGTVIAADANSVECWRNARRVYALALLGFR